jgi:hypothetical protein
LFFCMLLMYGYGYGGHTKQHYLILWCLCCFSFLPLRRLTREHSALLLICLGSLPQDIPCRKI